MHTSDRRHRDPRPAQGLRPRRRGSSRSTSASRPARCSASSGPNGAGKTTAVKLLLGLARPTAGDGEVLGRPIGDRATRRRVGYLPELFRYQAWLTAREVLMLHAQLAGLPSTGSAAAEIERRPRASSASPTGPTTASAGSRRACSSASASRRPCWAIPRS